MTAPPTRAIWDGPIAIGNGAPHPVDAFDDCVRCVDGIQDHMVAALRTDPDSHATAPRPILLSWASAAVVIPPSSSVPRTLCDVRERIWATCSHLDTTWAQELPGGVPFVFSACNFGSDIRRDALGLVDEARTSLERSVVADADDDGPLLMIDGSLRGHGPRRGTVGVVKTHRTRYLADERPLAALDAGWRTDSMVLPARTRDEADIWSCYVRLHPPRGDDWTFGLVRVEAWTAEDLARGAGAAVAYRQGPGGRDPRWDRHVSGVYLTEEILRARKIAIFDL